MDIPFYAFPIILLAIVWAIVGTWLCIAIAFNAAVHAIVKLRANHRKLTKPKDFDIIQLAN